jgi:hypothetical protein
LVADQIAEDLSDGVESFKPFVGLLFGESALKDELREDDAAKVLLPEDFREHVSY